MNQARKLQFGRQGFWAICLTLFMVAYNVSVMPAIMSSLVLQLNSSVGSIQSILVVFSLVTASFAPTTENLCRFYGRIRVFTIGLILYAIGIALTSLSPTIEMLAISFSLLTGLAGTPLISTPWAFTNLIDDDKARVGNPSANFGFNAGWLIWIAARGLPCLHFWLALGICAFTEYPTPSVAVEAIAAKSNYSLYATDRLGRRFTLVFGAWLYLCRHELGRRIWLVGTEAHVFNCRFGDPTVFALDRPCISCRWDDHFRVL